MIPYFVDSIPLFGHKLWVHATNGKDFQAGKVWDMRVTDQEPFGTVIRIQTLDFLGDKQLTVLLPHTIDRLPELQCGINLSTEKPANINGYLNNDPYWHHPNGLIYGVPILGYPLAVFTALGSMYYSDAIYAVRLLGMRRDRRLVLRLWPSGSLAGIDVAIEPAIGMYFSPLELESLQDHIILS